MALSSVRCSVRSSSPCCRGCRDLGVCDCGPDEARRLAVRAWAADYLASHSPSLLAQCPSLTSLRPAPGAPPAPRPQRLPAAFTQRCRHGLLAIGCSICRNGGRIRADEDPEERRDRTSDPADRRSGDAWEPDRGVEALATVADRIGYGQRLRRASAKLDREQTIELDVFIASLDGLTPYRI